MSEAAKARCAQGNDPLKGYWRGRKQTEGHINKRVHKIAKVHKGTIISPSGELYVDIFNLEKFCSYHDLCSSHLGAVLSGKRKSHKGWKLLQENG